MTSEQREHARKVIYKAVERFLNGLDVSTPLAECGEQAELRIKAFFTSDPNINLYGESPRPRGEVGKYLALSITQKIVESA